MYNFQGEKYNQNLNKINHINSWRKNLSLPIEKNELYTIYNTKTSLNPKLPYLFTNIANPIIHPLFSSYQFQNNINPYNYNNIYQNLQVPKIVMGLPVIIHKAKKFKVKQFTPTMTKTNLFIKGIKRNLSNLVVNNIIQETINTPQKINTQEKENPKVVFKKKKKIKLKKINIEKLMKRNRTEDNLERSIKPFFTTEIKSKKKWWNLLRFFTEIYYYFSILRKYTKKMKAIRNEEITPIEENLVKEVHKIRNWMLELQGDYWNNLLKYKNINIAFEEHDSKDKIVNNSKILLELLENYLNNLEVKTNDIKQIPNEIQKIIYRYIKKNAYFPNKYLNLFHVKRLNFDFYGSCLNNTKYQRGMILSYLLISNISAQQIFLNIKFIFKKLKPYENISLDGKYIASILYYLQKETFLIKPKINNNYINIFNYYRSYGFKNDMIEKEKNINILMGIKKTVNINKNIEDLYNDNKELIEDNIIDKFWEINSKTMKKLSNSLSNWSINLSQLLLYKFDK